MTLLIVPALIALIMKVFLLIASSSNSKANEKWVAFVTVFAVLNLCEVLLLFGDERGWRLENFLCIYYVLILAVMSYGLNYIVDSSMLLQRTYFKFCAAGSLVMMGFVIATDSIIYGEASAATYISAYKGDHFIYFKALVLAHLIGGLSFLLYNTCYWKSRCVDRFVNCLYALIGFLPLIVFGGAIILLLQKDFGVNALVVLPVCSTFFLMVTVKGQSIYLLKRDIRSIFPFTPESGVRAEFEWATTQYNFGKTKHKETMIMLERNLVLYKLTKHNWNVSRAASDMGLSPSTLYSMMERLKVRGKASGDNHDKG